MWKLKKSGGKKRRVSYNLTGVINALSFWFIVLTKSWTWRLYHNKNNKNSISFHPTPFLSRLLYSKWGNKQRYNFR